MKLCQTYVRAVLKQTLSIGNRIKPTVFKLNVATSYFELLIKLHLSKIDQLPRKNLSICNLYISKKSLNILEVIFLNR
jgi:hypothetical protein